MASRIRLRFIQPRRKDLHRLVALALIAPLLQVVQIAIPTAALAVSSNPFIANFNNATPGTFVVPAGVTSISINLKGGAGGTGGNDSRSGGNPGAVNVVTGNLTVTPGETLTYGVGGGGTSGNGCVQNSGAGPGGKGNFGGILGNYSGGNGANSGPWGCSGGGGGGGAATVLFSTTFGTVVAAGSGGGSGGDNCIPGNPGRRAGGGTGSKVGGAGQTRDGDGGGGGGGGGGWTGGVGGTTYFPCGEFIGLGGESGSNTGPVGTSGTTVAATAQAHGTLQISWTSPPNAPIIGSAIPGNTSATVSWTSGGTPSPSGSAITGFKVIASPGTATCIAANPARTSCVFAAGALTNGISYTFTVVATSSIGDSAPSAATAAVVPNTYTVTYDGNSKTGGTVPTDLTNHVTGATVTVKANTGTLVRSEYVFAGWASQSDGGGTQYLSTGSASFTIRENTTLFAKWTPVTYTTSYNGNSNSRGSAPTDLSSYPTGSTVIAKSNTGALVRTNYNFAGWNTLANGNGTPVAATGDATFTITSNTVLYAKWSQYKLTFNSNSATGGLPPTTTRTGGEITLPGPGTLVRTGFNFAGWATQRDGGGSGGVEGATFNLTADTTLYAKWSKYTITYAAGSAADVTGTPPLVQSGAGNVSLSTNFGTLARTNYYRAGWTTSSDGTGTTLTGSYNLAGSVKLYPRWAQYTITFDAGSADGATGTPPTPQLGAGNVTLSTNSGSLTRANFYRAGWTTNSDGTGSIVPSSYSLSASVTLYPRWAQYTITYANGNKTSGTVPFAQLGAGNLTLETNTGSLARTNFYWAGWTTSSDGTGTALTGSFTASSNVTLYPRWAQYAITYDMSGYTTAGSALTTLGFGSTTLARSAPGFSKDLATLGGWTTGPGETGDTYNLGAIYPDLSAPLITLYAKWLPRAGSTISIANSTLKFALADASKNFTEGNVAIRANETAGTRSSSPFVVSVSGTNCSISGSALDVGATSTVALSNADSGFVLTAAGIARCLVTISRPGDADFGPSTSTAVEFEFYPINQITPLLVSTVINQEPVGTPIAMAMVDDNKGDGEGTVSYAAYGNNCFITVSGSDYSLNATAPTQCRVIVTRAAWKQWAIATSQATALFTFTDKVQVGFVVPAKTVAFGTTISLYTTGGSGNGNVSYSTASPDCRISDVNKLTSSKAGTCTVVAYKSASGAFRGQTSAAARFTFTPINQAPITVTSPDAVDSNAVDSPGITLEISGGDGTGNVTFSAAPTPNCQITNPGSSTAKLIATSNGKCTVTAWKSASNGYNGRVSAPVTYFFGIAQTNELLIVSAGGITTSPQDVGFSLSTTGQEIGGGAISFARFNNSDCYFEPANGVAGTVVLKSNSIGSCNVQATQAASGAFLTSSSGLVTFTFTGGTQSALSLSFSSPDTSTTTMSGSSMNMVATGGSGSGTFTYTVSSLNGASCSPVTRLDPTANGPQSFATISSASPGTCVVTVVKSGDSRYRAAVATTNFIFTGGPQAAIILKAASAKAPSLSNVLITLEGGSGNGAVTFQHSGVGCEFVQGSQLTNPDSIEITAPSVTSCRVTATKAGSDLFTSAKTYGSNTVIVNFTTALQSALVTTVDGSDSGYEATKTADGTFVISSRGGSGSGLVTFAVYGNGNCKIDTSVPGTAYLTSTFKSVTCSVVAKKEGDTSFAPATAVAVSLSFTEVSQGDLSITSDGTSAAVGSNIKLTVTGGSVTGSLRYSANNSSGGLCVITEVDSNTATVTSTSVGNCSVTVIKSGSGIYSTKVATTPALLKFGEIQDPLVLVPEIPVGRDADNKDLIPESPAGTAIVLLLSGGSGSGSVTIYSGACTKEYNSGKVSINSAFPTTCVVSGAKAASGKYFGASSNTQSVKFVAVTQEPLIIDASATSIQVGENFTLNVTGGSGVGAYNVVVYGSGCSITSNSGGVAVITRATSGVCKVQGTRSSSGIYSFKISSTITLVWGQIAQTVPLVISNDPTSASAGQSITLTTVGGQGSGAVTFRVIGNYDPACVLVGNLLTKSAYGTCMVRATKAADGVYGAQNSQNIVFTFYGSIPQDPLMVDTSSPTSSLGNTITLSTTGGSGAGGVTYVIVGGDGTGTITGNKLSASSAGTFLIVATKQGDPQYASVVSSTAVFTFTG